MDYESFARDVEERTANKQELFVEERRRRKVEWDGETVKSVETERDSGASLRVFDDDRIGFSYANKFELDPDWLVDQAERTRSLLPVDEYHSLSDAEPSEGTVDRWYDPTIETASSDRVEPITDRLGHYLDAEPELKNLQVTFSESEILRYLFRDGIPIARERNTRFAFSTWAICDDGEDVQSGFERQSTFDFSRMDVDGVIERAIDLGKEKLGAVPPDSRTGPAILDRQAASGLLKLIKQMTNGESVVKGRSAWDEGELGEQVGVDSLSVIDDPGLEDGASNHWYDDEGHRMQPVEIIGEGTYRTFLTNQYVAERTGRENNHRASRTYSTRPGVGSTNFYLKPGDSTLSDMKGELGDGPVITGIQPASGLDPVAGHFSVGCSGYFVENGRRREPFDEATITGEIEDLLGNIRAIGTDYPSGYSVASPPLLVSELSLGGN